MAFRNRYVETGIRVIHRFELLFFNYILQTILIVTGYCFFTITFSLVKPSMIIRLRITVRITLRIFLFPEETLDNKNSRLSLVKNKKFQEIRFIHFKNLYKTIKFLFLKSRYFHSATVVKILRNKRSFRTEQYSTKKLCN